MKRQCFLAAFLVVLLYFHSASSQSVSLFGKFSSYLTTIDAREVAKIYSNCFNGLNLLTCAPTLPTDDQVYSWQLPYLLKLGDMSGQYYCLQCCSQDPNNVDIWDLSCPVDAGSRNAVNVYGYELSMATNEYSGDTRYVTCPLKRTACKYDHTGKTLSCDRASDNTYLVGYTLKLTVHLYNENFKYWRGVSKCEIESIESTTPLNVTQSFKEYIILDHQPPVYPSYDFPKIAIVLVLLVFVAYGALYFCRRKRCVYCQGKLVLSMSLCYKCRLVGAKPPDPVLLQALEEKGEILQGKIPERFVGARLLIGTIRLLYMMVCCTCFLSKKIYPSAIKDPLPFDTPIEDIEEAKMLESDLVQKIEKLKPSARDPIKFEKLKKKNPNILDFHPRLIFEAVHHPKYIQDDHKKKVMVIKQAVVQAAAKQAKKEKYRDEDFDSEEEEEEEDRRKRKKKTMK